MSCKRLEEQIDLLKIAYDKLWWALITTAGGLGTLLIKGINHFTYLVILVSLLLTAEIIGLFFIYLKVLKLAEILEQCGGINNGDSS